MVCFYRNGGIVMCILIGLSTTSLRRRTAWPTASGSVAVVAVLKKSNIKIQFHSVCKEEF